MNKLTRNGLGLRLGLGIGLRFGLGIGLRLGLGIELTFGLEIGSQLIEIRWFGKWAEFRNMSLIPAWKGHVSNSVHRITNAMIIHIELPNLPLK